MEPPMEESRKRIPSGCSVGRIINLVIIIVYLMIFVTALVTVGILGNSSYQLTHYYQDRVANASLGCPLYIQCDKSRQEGIECELIYHGGGVCGYVEASFGLIALLALVYIGVHFVRALFATNLWYTVMADLVAMALSLLFCFIAGVVLSIGIVVTCDQVKAHYSTHDCNQNIPDRGNPGTSPGSGSGTSYYSEVNAAQGAAWLCFLFLFVSLVVAIIRAAIFWRRRSSGVPISSDERVLTADDDLYRHDDGDAKPV